MMVKRIKYETKKIGYFILGNVLLWINVVIGYYLKAGEIERIVDILKYLGALGVLLLLGRKLIAQVITSAVTKKQ